MPTIPSYSAATAETIDSDDIFIMDVDGVTRKLSVAELKKIINRTEVNTQTDNYTLVLGDEGKVIRMNKGTPNTLTVPTNASVAFAVGTVIAIRQVGAGLTSVAAAGGVTINNSGLDLAGQNMGATLHKVGTNTWDLYIQSGEGGGVVSDPPVVTGMVIDEDGILISFDQSVTSVAGTFPGWSFEAEGSPITLTGSSQPVGTSILFTYSGTVLDTDDVTGSYDSGAGDTMGNTDELESFTDDPVTNNIPGGGYDADAQNIIDELVSQGETLDTTKEEGIDAWVVGLKGLSAWTSLECAVGLGSTANGQRTNLKTLTQCTITGTITHDSGGFDPNGSTGFINSGINPSTFADQNAMTMAYMSVEASSAGVFVMGAIDTNKQCTLAINFSNTLLGRLGDDTLTANETPVVTDVGFFGVSRLDATTLNVFRNATLADTDGGTSAQTFPNRNIYICAANDAGTANYFTDMKGGIALIFSRGFNTTDWGTLRTLTIALMTAFGR